MLDDNQAQHKEEKTSLETMLGSMKQQLSHSQEIYQEIKQRHADEVEELERAKLRDLQDEKSRATREQRDLNQEIHLLNKNLDAETRLARDVAIENQRLQMRSEQMSNQREISRIQEEQEIVEEYQARGIRDIVADVNVAAPQSQIRLNMNQLEQETAEVTSKVNFGLATPVFDTGSYVPSQPIPEQEYVAQEAPERVIEPVRQPVMKPTIQKPTAPQVKPTPKPSPVVNTPASTSTPGYDRLQQQMRDHDQKRQEETKVAPPSTAGSNLSKGTLNPFSKMGASTKPTLQPIGRPQTTTFNAPTTTAASRNQNQTTSSKTPQNESESIEDDYSQDGFDESSVPAQAQNRLNSQAIPAPSESESSQEAFVEEELSDEYSTNF